VEASAEKLAEQNADNDEDFDLGWDWADSKSKTKTGRNEQLEEKEDEEELLDMGEVKKDAMVCLWLNSYSPWTNFGPSLRYIVNSS